MSTAPLAVTLGDPAGIGPEICLKAWAALRDTGSDFYVIGDLHTLETRAKALGLPSPVICAEADFQSALPVVHEPLASEAEPGTPNPANGAAIIGFIQSAVTGAIAGEYSGIVTCPSVLCHHAICCC